VQDSSVVLVSRNLVADRTRPSLFDEYEKYCRDDVIRRARRQEGRQGQWSERYSDGEERRGYSVEREGGKNEMKENRVQRSGLTKDVEERMDKVQNKSRRDDPFERRENMDARKSDLEVRREPVCVGSRHRREDDIHVVSNQTSSDTNEQKHLNFYRESSSSFTGKHETERFSGKRAAYINSNDREDSCSTPLRHKGQGEPMMRERHVDLIDPQLTGRSQRHREVFVTQEQRQSNGREPRHQAMSRDEVSRSDWSPSRMSRDEMSHPRTSRDEMSHQMTSRDEMSHLRTSRDKMSHPRTSPDETTGDVVQGGVAKTDPHGREGLPSSSYMNAGGTRERMYEEEVGPKGPLREEVGPEGPQREEAGPKGPLREDTGPKGLLREEAGPKGPPPRRQTLSDAEAMRPLVQPNYKLSRGDMINSKTNKFKFDEDTSVLRHPLRSTNE